MAGAWGKGGGGGGGVMDGWVSRAIEREYESLIESQIIS